MLPEVDHNAALVEAGTTLPAFNQGASSSSAASTTLPPFNHLFGAASTTLPAFGRDILLSSAADATLPAPGRNIHHHSAASSTLPPLTHHPLPPPPSHDTFNAASATFHAADSGSTAAGGASGNDGLNAAPTDASNSWLQDSSAEPAMDEAAINEAAAYFRGYQDGYQQRGMEAGVSRVGGSIPVSLMQGRRLTRRLAQTIWPTPSSTSWVGPCLLVAQADCSAPCCLQWAPA